MMLIPPDAEMRDSAGLSGINESDSNYIGNSHTYRTKQKAVHIFTQS